MKIGISLPVTAPDAALTWARHIDSGPFDTVAVSDRLVYASPDPLITLAAVAGATSRVRLRTQVLLAALRDPVVLAKQVATLDRLSGGRFSLGVGLGDRADDYQAAGLRMSDRGRLLDDRIRRLLQVWPGGKPDADGTDGADTAQDIGTIGPRPASDDGPELLFGGFSAAAVQRVARWGAGYICAMVPDPSGGIFRGVEKAWQAAGREGAPQLIAQANVAIGPSSVIAEAKSLISSYYSFLDALDAPVSSAVVTDSMLTSEDQLRDALETCRQIGASELVFMCWSPDIAQLDRIAQVLD
ncbi:LLM class flavin-dependent oxidoreductase [Streptomyces sp. E11-3]|uniref:LLM class flavin-dependent oxidoreductase n=1 Tax=Streptomyces sp. E11-3 TaxID=3110112 RepID=UPI00397FFA32